MTEMPAQRWAFRARCERVVDGDTLRLRIDAGFHAEQIEQVRLLGVDAPELRGASHLPGAHARNYVANWIAHAEEAIPTAAGAWPWVLVVQTEKSDAFGRYLARVWRVSDGECLNDALLAAGHAVEYER